jgi:FAD binding domain
MICMLTKAHNLAWKLALVIKGHAADSNRLLESYTVEVLPF